MKRKYSLKMVGAYSLLVKQDWCVYCGARATTKDHFAPISVVSCVLAMGLEVTGKFLVPSCGECNAIAGDKIFVSIGAKRRFIQDRLRSKYARVLSMPDWSQSEIEQLGHTLQQSVMSGLAQRDYIRARLGWTNKHNSEPAKLAAVRLRMRAVGGLKFSQLPSNEQAEEAARRSRKRALAALRRENMRRVKVMA